MTWDRPLKGWKFRKLEDAPGSACLYCGTRIRWCYHLEHKTADPIVVGCECVKIFLDQSNARAALTLYQQDWRPRRHYFYKRSGGLVYVTGRRNGRWWLAHGESVRGGWSFVDQDFSTQAEVNQYLVALLCR